MTRTEFENKTFDDVVRQLYKERSDITTYDKLKDFAIMKIKKNDLFVAIQILEAIKYGEENFYIYDYYDDTLQLPLPITCKSDVFNFITD